LGEVRAGRNRAFPTCLPHCGPWRRHRVAADGEAPHRRGIRGRLLGKVSMNLRRACFEFIETQFSVLVGVKPIEKDL
jgi:hypothetical protein